MRSLAFVATLVAALALVASAVAIPEDTGSASSVSTETFLVPLTGPGGSGSATLTLNPGGKVCYVLDVTLTTAGDVPQEPAPGLGNAHIHVRPSGGVVVPLDAAFTSLGGGRFVASDCIRADKEAVRAVLANPAQHYVNIHTATFPVSAMEGSLA
jgi:hypothetical protein